MDKKRGCELGVENKSIVKIYPDFLDSCDFGINKIMSLVVFSLALAYSQSSEASGSGCGICDAGGVFLKTDFGSFGQGYLAYEEGELRLYTVKHVLDNSSNSVKMTINECLEDSIISKKQFSCENDSFDSDASCYHSFDRHTAKLLLKECKSQPFIRLRDHEELKIGASLLFLKPLSNEYSLAKIFDIDDEFIYADLSKIVNENGKEIVKVDGAFCQGRSGGPAILLEEGFDHNNLNFVLSDDNFVVVGELQETMNVVTFSGEDLESGLTCGSKAKIRRPIK